MKKKVRSAREKVIRRNLIGLLVYTFFGLIYPWGSWLLTAGKGSSHTCGNIISLDASMGFYLVGYFLLLLTSIPILFRRYISAVYIMLNGILSLFLIGAWFLYMAGLLMLCESLPYAEKLLMPILYMTIISSLAVLFLNRHRMRQVLDINGHMWNFETMEYTQLAIIVRPDGKNSGSVAILAYSAAFIGPLLVNIPIGDWLNMGESAKGWFMIMILWYPGIFFAGFLTLNELYLAWLIYAKSKRLGRKMLVKEFLPNK